MSEQSGKLILMHIHNISLNLKRFFAFIVDLLLLSIIFTIIYLKFIYDLLDPFENSIYPITIILYILFLQFYCIIFEYFTWGTSPGKYLYKIRIASKESNKLSITRILIRNLSKVILFVPPLFLMNEVYLFIALKKKFSDHISDSEITEVLRKLKVKFSEKEKQLIDRELQQQLNISLQFDEINLLKKFYTSSKYLNEEFKKNFLTKFLDHFSERIILTSKEISEINPHILLTNILYKLKYV